MTRNETKALALDLGKTVLGFALVALILEVLSDGHFLETRYSLITLACLAIGAMLGSVQDAFRRARQRKAN